MDPAADGGVVFVTVGTTSFDKLIETVCSETVCNLLQELGYSRLLVQIGRGTYEPVAYSTDKFSVEYYRYKDSISEDIHAASLVIGHAGAGTVLEILGAKKPLVVVINDELMDNHQAELAQQLHQDGHLLYGTPSQLPSVLQSPDLKKLKPFPNGNPKKFASFLDQVMGIS